jgi:CarD family transcriptional regulator
MVPVSNAAQIGLRRPMSEAQIRDVFRVLKVRDVVLDTQTWNRRYRALVEKMNTASVLEVAEVLRDLTLQRSVKDALSFSERQMLERARLLLVKEISVARGVDEVQVRAQVDAVFEKN